jgi:hypothetical protein
MVRYKASLTAAIHQFEKALELSGTENQKAEQALVLDYLDRY